MMIKLMNEMVMTDKEAADRYGYSPYWFQKMRSLKRGPPYLQMKGKGKVYYYVEKTDEWFRENMVEK
ncbi:MAG TPA: hypothetical protein VNY36_03215 [Bacteroidia bacterium]|nr:hypothetical protein [Bacteroidia bacterium]